MNVCVGVNFDVDIVGVVSVVNISVRVVDVYCVGVRGGDDRVEVVFG